MHGVTAQEGVVLLDFQPSRYTTTRNKKLQTEKLEIKKYNPFLRRHTVHREIK